MTLGEPPLVPRRSLGSHSAVGFDRRGFAPPVQVGSAAVEPVGAAVGRPAPYGA